MLALSLAALVAWLGITLLVGLRQGFLFLIGVGFGAVLAGVSFGFTTGWRVWIRDRDPTGLLAQFVAIGLAMAVTIPLLASHPELSGAIAPVSVSVVIGAFVFGLAMQVADGCGSGTLYKAGLGNAFALLVLPGFIAGSFFGSLHLDRWLALGALEPIALQDHFGAAGAVALQVAVMAVLAVLLWRRRRSTQTRWRGRGIYIGAVLLAVFGVLNLIVAGQPWGIVYGLGLWGAKIASALGMDLSTNAFWGRESQQALLHASVLTDVTSITNFGLLAGSLIAATARGTACPPPEAQRASQWIAALVAGLALGYSSRLAFGCNVGAYFSGISSGSLHGWIWFAAAFAGSLIGVKVRTRLGLPK
ncbi:MAG TPA: YeeE/YedE family protein [Burkholderiaceae bacterium]|nr:YeeE/YedE family protein [Burkholderiaceae bacterium]